MQRKFASICHNSSLQDMEYHYNNLLEKLNLLTLYVRRRQFDTLFLTNVFSGALHVCYPSLLETAGIHVSTPSATALQQDLYLLQMQCVNIQIFLLSRVLVQKALATPFFFVFIVYFVVFVCFVLLSYCCCCLYSF
jgi:hypothetical protein